jgi:hypothetical protein
MPQYLLDSNFFISAHRQYYPLDVFPSFWQKIESLAKNGTLLSIDKVKDEIMGHNDTLAQWLVTSAPPNFFCDSGCVIQEYSRIANWANSLANHYSQAAINEFLSADEADAWLVAYSLSKGTHIITYEKSEPNAKRKIKIPEPCTHFGIPFLQPMDLFRQLGERF